MGKLLKIKALVLFGLWRPCLQGSDSYCSLVVQVLNQEFQEVEAKIAVHEKDGTVHLAENVPGGRRFCSLGLSAVDIVVGSEACNQVTIKNVPMVYQATVRSRILYDRPACLVDPPPEPGPQCKIMLRFYDTGKQPIQADVRIKAPVSSSVKTDEEGRQLLIVPKGAALQAAVGARGFKEEQIRLECLDPEVSDRKIYLKRAE